MSVGGIFGSETHQQLQWVYSLMREMSVQTDPQAMIQAYGKRMREWLPVDLSISLSRRGLSGLRYRITRFSGWDEEINPWKQRDRLPLLEGGLLAELIYGDQPRIINDLQLTPGDPAAEYLDGQRSVLAIPLLDAGESLNMVVLTKGTPSAFLEKDLPNIVWMSNLFGRATNNLVLKEQVREAYEALDRELHVVGAIQRSLLPSETPPIEGLDIAASYQTSQRAGGDYYDFFPLADGKWGILIADVSGHGTPAAVVMAITHSIAHLFPNETGDPADLLTFVNSHLCGRYTAEIEAFVTAFYGIYDPATGLLHYSSAGHNPGLVVRCGAEQVTELDQSSGLPLGIDGEHFYTNATVQLAARDYLVLYTDGLSEAAAPDGTLFGIERLQQLIRTVCGDDAENAVAKIVAAVEDFSGSGPLTDDRSLVVARVEPQS